MESWEIFGWVASCIHPPRGEGGGEEEAKEGDLRNLSKARGGGGKFSRKAAIVNRPPLKRFEDFSRGEGGEAGGRTMADNYRPVTRNGGREREREDARAFSARLINARLFFRFQPVSRRRGLTPISPSN